MSLVAALQPAPGPRPGKQNCPHFGLWGSPVTPGMNLRTGMRPFSAQRPARAANRDWVTSYMPKVAAWQLLLAFGCFPLLPRFSCRGRGNKNGPEGAVLEIEAGADAPNLTQPKREDAKEIRNYRIALQAAARSVQDQSLTPHLLRAAHALLLDGVRGRDKDPGAFRTEQNWIGPVGCTIEQAQFVPIAPEHLGAGIDAWAANVASRAEPDPLVQLALIHVEFEAPHPFKDGNGRLGRMLIPLFPYERKLLGGPNFYISGYLEARREQYVDRLRAVSCDGAWTEWCAFFLEGLIDQASENQAKARAILELHQQMLRRVSDITHSHHAGQAVDFLFSRPVLASTHFVEGSEIPRPTALRFLALLRDGGILRVIQEGAGRRPTVYAFPALLTVTEGREVL